MSEQGAAKTCVICKVDLTSRPRTRDRHGKYFCNSCYEKALAAKHQRLARERNDKSGSATHSGSQTDLDLGLTPCDGTTGELLDELTTPPLPVPQRKPRDPRECPACGHVMVVGAVLCTNCGHNLSSGTTLEVYLPTAGSSRIKAPQRTSTTVYAIVCAVFGALGFLVNMLVIGGSGVIDAAGPALTGRSDFSLIVSMLCNVGLVALGVLLYMRNPIARPVTLGTFAMAMIGALTAVIGAAMQPAQADADLFGGTLGIAGVVIRILVMAVIAWFYWLILRHLGDPATRVEFGMR